jgi:predicted transcriptional regulator
MPREPLRAIRVPDELWHAAQAVAAERNESLAKVIREALARYVARNR